MAGFSRLPNEMISEIWGNIHAPEDVESFALVSKRIYATGSPFVEEHNKLKKDFAFFRIGSEKHERAPASLLKKVLLRPRIAQYVTHLSFGRFRHLWDEPGDNDFGGGIDDQWPNDGHVPYPDNVMALFIEMIRKPSFVPRNETSDWIKSVRQGDEDPIFALLCMLLPNLSMLTLSDAGFYAEKSQKTILRIAETEKTMLLKHHITVNGVSTNLEGNIELAWLRTLAALPSVQIFHFDYVVMDEVDGVDDADVFVSDSYSVRELTFTRSGFHPKVLAQLLDSVKGLKRFSYVYPNKNLRLFKPFWIRTALLANAKHSLEYLEILPDWDEEPELLGTLRGFAALKELKTNIRFLCRRSTFDGLANILPSSIEKLYLDTRCHTAHDIVPALVEEIAEAKTQLVPHLRVLGFITRSDNRIIQEYRSMIEPLEEKCQNVGIELLLNKVV